MYRIKSGSPLSEALSLGHTDTLKLQVTALEDKTAKRPHQAFLTLRELVTGLEESFAIGVKDSGKGKLELVKTSLPNLSAAV